MKNRFIKVTILIFVIAGITTAIILTQQSISKFTANQSIKSFEFENYAKQMVDDSIIGDSSNAKVHYVKIYDIIKTENSIQSNAGKIISQNVADECYRYAFSAYWNIYNNKLSNYFSTSQKDWTSGKRNEISKELKDLKGRNGSSDNVLSIEKYETYLSNYKKALDLIENSKRCTDYNSYKNICNEYPKYQERPYKNARDLQKKLSEVSSNAATSWKNYVLGEIYALTNKDFSMDEDKSNFTREYRELKSKWTSYENTISQYDNDIIQAKNRLDKKGDEWTDYFRAKAQQRNSFR